MASTAAEASDLITDEALAEEVRFEILFPFPLYWYIFCVNQLQVHSVLYWVKPTGSPRQKAWPHSNPLNNKPTILSSEYYLVLLTLNSRPSYSKPSFHKLAAFYQKSKPACGSSMVADPELRRNCLSHEWQ